MSISSSASDPKQRFDRLAPAGAWLFVLAASVAFRLPSLLNAAHTTSDAAIVGLQGMHILRGEWSVFLHGSGYQTSVDSFVAAAWFVLLGPTPLALRLSSFVGHVILTLLAFSMVRRHASPAAAVALVLPLIFTPGPLHTYILYPPRQTSLTLAFASLWLLDRASVSARPRLQFAAGAATGALAAFADPYALLFAPVIALFGGLACLDARPGRVEVLRRAGAALLGGLVGAVPYGLLRRRPGTSHGPTSLSLAHIESNARRLWEDCLGWALSYKVQYAQRALDYGPWTAPAPFHAAQIIGALLFVALVLSGAVALFARALPWELRRLGVAGAAMLPLNVAGFLLSPMVLDIYSSRYLVAMILMAPLAMAPAARWLGDRKLALSLAPYVVSAAVGGWLSFAPLTDGLAIRMDSGRAADERAVAAMLQERGIPYAYADYWVAYRLTFLFRESPVVVPSSRAEDRYPPYRAAFERAPVVAYVYDPLRSGENLEQWLGEIAAGQSPYEPSFERVQVGRYTVTLLRRRKEAAPLAGAAPR